MNSIPEVEDEIGITPFEEINPIKDNSHQNLVASLRTVPNEKPPFSILNNNHIFCNASPKTRASTKELSNKHNGNNNCIAANDFFGVPKKCLRRNSKYNSTMSASHSKPNKRVSFKMPFAYIVDIESFKKENYECAIEAYKRRKRSSAPSLCRSCCKKIHCLIT
jgi:hypothetical protein